MIDINHRLLDPQVRSKLIDKKMSNLLRVKDVPRQFFSFFNLKPFTPNSFTFSRSLFVCSVDERGDRKREREKEAARKIEQK